MTSAAPAPARRRPYLDWLRGIGVLIMIEGHTLDSWTRVADRASDGYRLAILVAGIGAPLFLFLAGVSLPLAARSRLRKGLSPRQVTATAFRRGAWIFALAFLFRLQSMVISGGAFPQSLLKVDILNVMGVAMLIAALLWGAGRSDWLRAALFVAVTAGLAMLTPMVRTAGWIGALPDAVEWYLRPSPGSTTFTLLPWAGFLTAGAAVGIWLARASTPAGERQVNGALLVIGAVTAFGGYAASLMPPLFANSSFWTSSPTFFFIRLGIVVGLVPVAAAVARVWPAKALQDFGRASLFVYWIHVEMAYGVVSFPLHRALPFEMALVALMLFTVLLFGIVRLKERFMGRGRSPELGESGSSPIRPAQSAGFLKAALKR